MLVTGILRGHVGLMRQRYGEMTSLNYARLVTTTCLKGHCPPCLKMEGKMKYWNVEDMAVGDIIKVMVVNKKGDRNLDGVIISGRIKDLEPKYDMVRLESGWCCHTKDRLLDHQNKEQSK